MLIFIHSRSLKAIVLCLLLSMPGACTYMMFQPIEQQVFTPDIVDTVYEDIYLESASDIRLHGWKLYSAKERRGVVLFLHGNGENISTHFANIYWLTRYGYDCYIFDYRGYGKSDGEAELDGVVHDVGVMLNYVLDVADDDEKVIVMGHSLGGALAIQSVADSQRKQEISALVTVEAFSDYREITRDLLSNSWLTWLFQWPLSFTIDNSYSPVDAVADVSPVPLLVMHSRSDNVVRFDHAMRLYQAARLPKQFVEIESDHIRIFNDDKNRQLLIDYLESL